jgi:NADH-quinone oxidoreductase subunit E
MADVPNKNAPSLGGWIIAAGMGLVAFGVAKVIGEFDWTPAVAIGAVVALIAGLIMGMPWGQGKAEAAATAKPTAHSAPAAKPVQPESAAADPVVSAAPVATPPASAAPAPASFLSEVPPAAPAPAEAPAAKAAKAPAAKAEKAPAAKAEKARAAKVAKAPAAKAEKAPAEKAAKAPAKPKAAKPSGPEILTAPRGGKADDLKQIEGIGPAMEKLVNGFGVYHFDQIASWSDADVAFFDAKMDRFKGRITRDKWVAQAKIIVTEGLERFLERAKTNDY